MDSRTVYDYINSAYELVALAAGIKGKIWEYKREATDTPRVKVVRDYWLHKGLLEGSPQGWMLTVEGLEIVACADLINYELSMISIHREDDLETKPATLPPLYHQLRRGLGGYFDQYLSQIFTALGLVNMNIDVLEIGAGCGAYSEQFIKQNPLSAVYPTDREPDRPPATRVPIWEFDFEAGWPDDSKRYELVIAAEVFHCKNDGQRAALFAGSYKVLEDKGQLLVVERTHTRHLAWRLALMSTGECLMPGMIEGEGQAAGYRVVRTLLLGKEHYATLLRKE